MNPLCKIFHFKAVTDQPPHFRQVHVLVVKQGKCRCWWWSCTSSLLPTKKTSLIRQCGYCVLGKEIKRRKQRARLIFISAILRMATNLNIRRAIIIVVRDWNNPGWSLAKTTTWRPLNIFQVNGCLRGTAKVSNRSTCEEQKTNNKHKKYTYIL